MPEDQSKPTEPETTAAWNRMWLPRITYATATVLVVLYGALWIFRSTGGFLITLVIALFAAFALLPAVESLSRRGWRRGVATGVVMFTSALFGAFFIYTLLNVAVGQIVKLVGKAPSYAESAVSWVNSTFGTTISSTNLVSQLTADQSRVQELSSNAVSGVLGLAATALGLVFQALTIGLFVFYILADLPRLRNAIFRRLPPTSQLHADTVIEITIEKVGGYVYSRSLLALVSALFHFAAFKIIGLPYAVALAMWVGIVSQFVPAVGTYIAGVFPLLIALVEDPIDAIWVLAAILAYQQVENYVLSPRITANTMDLHPAVAFGAAIVGGSLLGGVGALLALPVAATITALVQTYGDHYEVIASGRIESPAEYEARMRAAAVHKERRRRDRLERLRDTTVPWRDERRDQPPT